MSHPFDQATAQHDAAGYRLWLSHRLAPEVGPLVNIDHNTPFFIFGHRRSKEGPREPSEAAVRSSNFLAKVGNGTMILKDQKGRIIYTQGEEADRSLHCTGQGHGDRRSSQGRANRKSSLQGIPRRKPAFRRIRLRLQFGSRLQINALRVFDGRLPTVERPRA